MRVPISRLIIQLNIPRYMGRIKGDWAKLTLSKTKDRFPENNGSRVNSEADEAQFG